MRALGADPEVGADGGDPVVLAQAGAGRPAVAELLLLVDEAELLALVGLRLDAADLVRARLVVEQQHDQAADRAQALVPVAAGELVAGLRGEVAALAVVDEHGPVGARAVADAGDQLAGAAQHRGEPLDPLLGDLASRVGGELDLLQGDALDPPVDGRVGDRDVEQGGAWQQGRVGFRHLSAPFRWWFQWVRARP